MIFTRAACLGLAALVGLTSTPLLGQVEPEPAKHFARVELAISCNQSTPENQKDYLPFAVYSGRDKLCVDGTTFVRNLQVTSVKLWQDNRTHIWWLIARFPDAAKPVVDAVCSRAYGRELALILNGKVLSSGLDVGEPLETEYSTSTESKEIAMSIARALSSASAH